MRDEVSFSIEIRLGLTIEHLNRALSELGGGLLEEELCK